MSPDQAKILRIAAVMRRRRHALFGAHARNAYLPDEPRTTADVDFLVPDAAAAKRAGAAILDQIRGLRARVLPFGMVQILNARGTKIADLVPADEPITMAAVATAKRKAVPAVGPLRVPPRELLIAMKLDSAGDSRRQAVRADQDWTDARAMFEAGTIDERALLAALDLVSPHARKLYRRLKSGRRLWE